MSDPRRGWWSLLREIAGVPARNDRSGRTPAPAPAPPRSDDAWPDPDARQGGALRAVHHLGDFPLARITSLVPDGVSIENGYSLYTIALWSGGEESRATVAAPFGVEPPAGGWHLAANNHGTTGLGHRGALVDTDAGAGLAAVFGARGVLGVAPEYAGLTVGGVQPYLVAASASRAAIDALRATRTLARWKGWPLSGRAAMVGLSQGGHATLAVAARHATDAPDLDLRAFAVAAPASAWEEHWRAGALRDGRHLVYHAMLCYAWARHYGHRGPPIWPDKMARTVDAILPEVCAWSPRDDDKLEDRLPRKAAEIFAPDFLRAYRSGKWGPFATFRDAFDVNRLRAYSQTAPLRVYQGSRDRAIPELATRQLVAALRRGGVSVDYQVVPGGNHLDTAFGFLGVRDRRTAEAVAWVRAMLDR